MMNYLVRLSILAFMVIFPVAIAVAPPCRRSCGDKEIPYPFGLFQDGPHCYFNESYAVDCYSNATYTVPYWGKRNLDFWFDSISLEDHEVRMPMYIGYDCYASNDSSHNNNPNLDIVDFPISSTKNKFVAIGCDTYAVFSMATDFYNEDNYKTGCLTTCTDLSSVAKANGSCSGIGCCFSTIPRNVYSFNITVSSYNNHRDVLGFNNCSYAFVVANDSFNFSAEYLSNFTNEMVPIVIDWSVGDGTCEEAKMNMTSYMCQENSTCYNVTNGRGYQCRCWEGYQGNPYLSGDAGCQDVDECNNATSPCAVNARCHNTVGNFTCLCKKGHHGDGRKSGSGCIRKKLSMEEIALGVSISISLLLLLCFWLYYGIKQRKIIKQRKEFFQQNGGLMLPTLLAEHNASLETSRIFTDDELKKATNNYHRSTILGQGGHGIVYKGELNNKIVAIKKSKLVDHTQVKEFLNEVVLLTQINHKNVVKLIGCCLEAKIPLLVYEFIANGTLLDHIQNLGDQAHMSWRNRLRIAAETAGALCYLHTEASTQIIHRDVKTANILLDNKYTAKISDFGASRLVPNDEVQVATLVQGTYGYLDPECHCGIGLTDKSDVYSFGVVLAELLTGMIAFSFTRPEKERSLAMYFVSKYNEGKLLEIIDNKMFQDEFIEEIKEVAKLATWCLQTRGKERPSMREVSLELEGLRVVERQLWAESNRDETEFLLAGEVTEYGVTATRRSMPYDSTKDLEPFRIESGR